MSREDYFAARKIAEPLCLFDCDIPVEGCVALVLTTAERAQDLPNPARLCGRLWPEHEPAAQPVSLLAGRLHGVWRLAGHQAVGVVRSGSARHERRPAVDGYSPSAMYWLEAAGFCPQGQAHAFIQDGRIALEGELPVNTFGGSLSEGRLHGMGHIAEAVLQVTGRADTRQVPDAGAACAIDGSPMLRGSGLVVTKEP